MRGIELGEADQQLDREAARIGQQGPQLGEQRRSSTSAWANISR